VIDLNTKKIGILGAGQLGRMFALASANLGIHPYFLDKQSDFPAGLISHQITEGDFTNYDDVLSFGLDKDILTIEIENVNTDALLTLEEKGVQIYPQANIIELIKDKGKQKQFYKENHFPSSKFILYENKIEVLKDLENGSIYFPFVQKLRTEGYDGKGVLVVKSQADSDQLFDKPSVIEELVDIDKELAVIVARNKKGETNSFPVVEMVFDPIANLVDYLKYPANLQNQIKEKCRSIADQMAQKIDLIGILAIEFFLTKSGELLINEMAPRTHNSGHFSMDACITSQFEQHLRAICDLPLGSTEANTPCIMLNILGPNDYVGPAKYPWLPEILKIKGVKPHIYGKKTSKPYRKLGHINIIHQNDLSLVTNLNKVKSIIKNET